MKTSGKKTMEKRILLCDDEIHILRAAEFKLRRAGFDVRTASDGEEGWQLLLETVPDILVTDCQMPRLDGPGLIRRVRNHPASADLPILMLTAKGLELDVEALQSQWNVIAVIAKPFSPRALLRTIETAIAGEMVGVGD